MPIRLRWAFWLKFFFLNQWVVNIFIDVHSGKTIVEIILRFCMYLLEIEIDIEIISVVVYTHMQNDSIESYKGNVGPLKF